MQEKSRRRQPSGRRICRLRVAISRKLEGRRIRRPAQALEIFPEIIGFLLEPAKGGLAIVIERAVSRRPLGASARRRPSTAMPGQTNAPTRNSTRMPTKWNITKNGRNRR